MINQMSLLHVSGSLLNTPRSIFKLFSSHQNGLESSSKQEIASQGLEIAEFYTFPLSIYMCMAANANNNAERHVIQERSIHVCRVNASKCFECQSLRYTNLLKVKSASFDPGL